MGGVREEVGGRDGYSEGGSEGWRWVSEEWR